MTMTLADLFEAIGNEISVTEWSEVKSSVLFEWKKVIEDHLSQPQPGEPLPAGTEYVLVADMGEGHHKDFGSGLFTTYDCVRTVPPCQPQPVAQGEAVAWIEHHKGGDNLNWERVDHPYAAATPLYKADTAVCALSGWVDDPDSIPKPIVDACREAIRMEFGDNGTDGYYKRILAKVIAALLSASPSAGGV